MEVSIQITANEDEIDEVVDALGSLASDATPEDLPGVEDLSEAEASVLRAVRGAAKGMALRTVHREAAQIDDSITWVNEWGDERERVQSLLGSLRNKNLVRLESRSYYPVEISDDSSTSG